MNNRLIKISKISLIIVLVAIVVYILFLFLQNPIQKMQLSMTIKNMGKDYYENHFYADFGANTKTLSSLSENGVSVDLATLISELDYKNSNQFKNKKTKRYCNFIETKIKLYPKSPFGVKDYDIRVIISCGF